MTVKQEEAEKMLRRLWREFCEKVGRSGNCKLSGSVELRETDGHDPVVEVFARVTIEP